MNNVFSSGGREIKDDHLSQLVRDNIDELGFDDPAYFNVSGAFLNSEVDDMVKLTEIINPG